LIPCTPANGAVKIKLYLFMKFPCVRSNLAPIYAIAIISASVSLLQAAATAPCTGGAHSETVLPVGNTVQAYCISDYGWSDTWFSSPVPTTYSNARDVLSGDDSPFIRYTVGSGNTLGGGTGFLSPSMDRGTLTPQDNGTTRWEIVQALSYTSGTNVAESVIRSVSTSDGLQIAITTTVVGYQVSLHFQFTNTGAPVINNLRFGDYWNYHPNGSQGTDSGGGRCDDMVGCVNGNATLGTTFYTSSTGIVRTTGVLGPSFNSNGQVFGERLPDAHQVDTLANIFAAIANNTYTGSNGPVTGDRAAAIVWDLGSLTQGQSTDFYIYKELDAPEPSSFVLLGMGGVLIGIRLRRKTS